MKSILIHIAIYLALIGSIFFMARKINSLTTQLSSAIVNNKSLTAGMSTYKDKNGMLHTQSIQQAQTIRQLKDSKDSTTARLVDDINSYKIKLKTVTQAGIIKTKLVHDTTVLYKPGRDSVYDLSKRPDLVHLISLKGEKLTDSLQINNKQDLVWHTHKETVNPPYKFFLWRWFQSKQTITNVDIQNSNKLINTTGQEFIIVTK